MSRSGRTAAAEEQVQCALRRATLEPDRPDILTGGEAHGAVATGHAVRAPPDTTVGRGTAGESWCDHFLPAGKSVMIQTKKVERDDARQRRARLIYRLEFGPFVAAGLGDVTFDWEKQALP